MTRKSQSILALACLGLLGMAGNAAACSTAQWNGGTPGAGTLLAAQPDSATPVPRYFGKCALRSSTVDAYVQDNTPSAEAAYRAQFYVYTGLASGAATVFQALNNSNAPAITVNYDATAGQFAFTAGASTTVGSILQNKWYAVNLTWTNGGNMDIRVQGANSLTATTATVAAGSSNIETVKLGWVANGATPGATDATHLGIVTDSFESRRATEIPRVCRGNATSDTIYSIQDVIAVTNEILRLNGDLTKSISSFSADANEDGLTSIQDRILVTSFILNGKVCPTTAHAANET